MTLPISVMSQGQNFPSITNSFPRWGLGVDIIEVERIRRALERHKRFMTTIYTPSEIEYCLKSKLPHRHFALRFAAKEAVFKALGTGLNGFQWKMVEIVNRRNGCPSVLLHDAVLRYAQDSGVEGIKVSLSLSRENAIAVAMVVRKDDRG